MAFEGREGVKKNLIGWNSGVDLLKKLGKTSGEILKGNYVPPYSQPELNKPCIIICNTIVHFQFQHVEFFRIRF